MLDPDKFIMIGHHKQSKSYNSAQLRRWFLRLVAANSLRIGQHLPLIFEESKIAPLTSPAKKGNLQSASSPHKTVQKSMGWKEKFQIAVKKGKFHFLTLSHVCSSLRKFNLCHRYDI